MPRRKRRQQPAVVTRRPLRLRRFLPWVLLLFVILLVYCAWLHLTAPGSLPFRHVKVSGDTHYINQTNLQDVIQQRLEGGFFTLNTDEIRETALSFPWVKDVSIRRVWPDTLQVDVTEHQALAHWGDEGVLAKDGTVFYPVNIQLPANLPELVGPDNSQQKLIKNYQLLNQDISILGVTIKKLTLSDRLSWSITLSNNIRVVMGEGDPEPKFAEFVKLYPKLIAPKVARISYVDMRYPNGLAIKFKK